MPFGLSGRAAFYFGVVVMTSSSGDLQMERPKHAELRSQSGKSIAESALWLGVSSGHLSNCERGLAKLTPDEDASLCSYYLTGISERLSRLAACLPAGKISGSEKANEPEKL
jgi:hypothetical protein